MFSGPPANINPAVLAWAREQARLTVEEAAKKVGVKPERFAAWEDPDDEARRPSGNCVFWRNRCIGRPACSILPSHPRPFSP